MRTALERHDRLIESAVERTGGTLVRPGGEGDSRFAVCRSAGAAATAAIDIQRVFADEPWALPEPLQVRMALHSGEAELRENDYYGPVVNLCARLRSLAHAGQVLVSE